MSRVTVREALGLALLVLAVALVPVGWHASRLLWLLSLIGLALGVTLFYSERMRKREEQIEKERTGGSGGHAMPTDIHNYTGWRSGGRSETLEDSFGSSGGDAD